MPEGEVFFTMSMYPETTCLMCDLPWKNNRVCYDGKLALNPKPRHLAWGNTELTLQKDGIIVIGDHAIITGYHANDTTVALDALHRLLFFASENRMIAFDLQEQTPQFFVETQGTAGAPLLFEWLLPDGEICEALGFCDGKEHYFAVDRVTGQPLWVADILGTPCDTAAHMSGYLYLVMEEDPYQVMCLEADSGDVVWWNRATGRALGGVICNGCYCVKEESGDWQRFRLIDGEKLA